MNAISYFSLTENMKKTIGINPEIIIPFMMNLVLTCGPQNKWETLVDLGCGFGNSTSLINKIFQFKEIICVDGSETLLGMLNARKNEMFGNTPVATFRKNLETEQIPVKEGVISMVSSYGTACYLEQLDNLFAEASRILKSGGIFFLDMQSRNGKPLKNTNISQKGLESYVHSEENIAHLSAKSHFLLENYSIKIENPEIGPGCLESYLFFRKT